MAHAQTLAWSRAKVQTGANIKTFTKRDVYVQVYR